MLSPYDLLILHDSAGIFLDLKGGEHHGGVCEDSKAGKSDSECLTSILSESYQVT